VSDTTRSDPAPTVVLVQGAFADSSSWAGTIERLQARHVRVIAAANPLRGITVDSAYVRSMLEQIPGPVLAVGHSYGGAVISNAATDIDNVFGLVFVAAYAPDDGERLGELSTQSTDSVLSSVLVPHPYPSANGVPDVEFTIEPAELHHALAGDLPAVHAAILAATQRPISELALSEPSGPPAWRARPSWAVIPNSDKAAGTDLLRAMARRAGAHITEIEGSHVVMISQPDLVTAAILDARHAAPTAQQPATASHHRTHDRNERKP
jgi:pimeloyl-ACP methyl ester carboxylesterase